MKQIYLYDPTANDEQSKVRGIGRYVQTLKDAFSKDWKVTSDLSTISHDSTFINPFFNFLQKPLTINRIAKKQITVIHDLIPLKYPEQFPIGLRGSLNVWLNKIALKNYDLIVTDSEASKKDIVRMLRIPPEKITVIYPCLGNAFFNSTVLTTNYSLPTTNYCIYVGDATWNKNLITLAKAIKLAGVTCVFVGKIFENYKLQTTNYELNHPWQAELKGFLEEIKDDPRFELKGFVTDEELLQLYRNATCNILVSRDEGFGYSVVEAGAVGTPTVAADEPIFHEISGDQALFACKSKPADIAEKIKQLFSNEAMRNEISEKIKQRSQFFSEKNFIAGWEKLISSI